MGSGAIVEVVGYAEDSHGQAVAVDVKGVGGQVACANAFPHVTLSTASASDTGPVYSNTLFERLAGQGVVLPCTNGRAFSVANRTRGVPPSARRWDGVLPAHEETGFGGKKTEYPETDAVFIRVDPPIRLTGTLCNSLRFDPAQPVGSERCRPDPAHADADAAPPAAAAAGAAEPVTPAAAATPVAAEGAAEGAAEDAATVSAAERAAAEAAVKAEWEQKAEAEGYQDDDEDLDLEDEEAACGFCLFMRAGPCGIEFRRWEKCLERCKTNDTDFVEMCTSQTLRLKDCIDLNPEYYAPLHGGDDDEEEQDQEAAEQEGATSEGAGAPEPEAEVTPAPEPEQAAAAAAPTEGN
jgi:hypothetical protein